MPFILAIVAVIAAVLLGASSPFSQNQAIQQPINNLNNQEACKPRINKDRRMKVDVRDDLYTYYINNLDYPEFNKEEKEWVLVKENAPIPAWKVNLETHGTRGSEDYGEMEHLGKAINLKGDNNNSDVGKDVYIGTGWCSPETGQGHGPGDFGDPKFCLDPLVQDVLFVAVKKGGQTKEPWLMDHNWPKKDNPTPAKTPENLSKYYWTFNVYYDASKLPANADYEDLPCWMKLACPAGGDVMGKKRRDAQNTPNCEVSNVLGASDPARPRLIISKDEMIPSAVLPQGINWNSLSDYYISSKKTEKPNDPIIGTAYNNHFNIHYRKSDVLGSLANHVLILDPSLSGHSQGPFWEYIPVLQNTKPQTNSLQLGTFNPGIPSYFYEWWTPSCKPAIYLYPEKTTEISVKVRPKGKITESIPDYGENGWTVTANPNGTLYPNRTAYSLRPTAYDYLYYEAEIENLKAPKNGWIIEKNNLEEFFVSLLPQLGLNKKETQDFLSYWLTKLSKGDKWFIGLIERDELDRIEPIEFSVTPDTFIRVRFYFEEIDNKINLISNCFNCSKQTANTKSQLGNWKIGNYLGQLEIRAIRNFKRKGFTAVDWGGIIANGSCGLNEKSQ